MLDKQELILVVDDMRMMRNVVKKILGQLGYENIVEAENGKEAWTKYNELKDDDKTIGAIFMDIVMPMMNGKEVLMEIRKVDAKTPVVMLSSVADNKMIEDCKRMGITDYILKPINTDTGPKIIGDILAKVEPA